jgi:hypothetical protein
LISAEYEKTADRLAALLAEGTSLHRQYFFSTEVWVLKKERREEILPDLLVALREEFVPSEFLKLLLPGVGLAFG